MLQLWLAGVSNRAGELVKAQLVIAGPTSRLKPTETVGLPLGSDSMPSCRLRTERSVNKNSHHHKLGTLSNGQHGS